MSVFFRVYYVLRDARDGLLRHPGANLAALLLVAAAVFAFTAAQMLADGLEGVAALLEAQTKMRAFLSDQTDPDAAAAAARALPGVRNVTIESAEEALARFRNAVPAAAALLVAFGDNPFPNALIIEPASPSAAARIAEALPSIPGVEEVVWAQPYLERITALAGALRWLGGLGLIGLFALAFLVTALAFHLHVLTRQDEIDIRLLVGASSLMVRAQFAVEALLLGALGGLLGSWIGWE
ncbi:MAG TPA: permease-like cell division protein FtsX, partial [Bacillota bacterium]